MWWRIRLLLDWIYDQIVYPLTASGREDRTQNQGKHTIKDGD